MSRWNVHEFILYKISSKDFSNTLAASSISVATVMSFLISSYPHYGLLVLVCIPLFIYGEYLFIIVLEKSNLQIERNETICDIIKSSFQSNFLSSLVSIITTITLVSIIFLELYIGTEVLKLISDFTSRFMLFILIAVIAFIYVRIGGFKAVVRSDTIQLYLIISSFSLLFIYILNVLPHFSGTVVKQHHFFGQASMPEIVSFIIIMAMINLLTPFALTTDWHRVIATQNFNKAKLGIKQSIFKVCLTWGLPVLSVCYLSFLGYNISGIDEFFSIAFSQTDVITISIKYFSIIALIACIMSSIDTNIISIIFLLKNKISQQQEQPLKFRYISFVVSLIFITQLIFYSICLTKFKDFIMFAIYVIFGQLIVICPICIASLYCLKNKISFSINLFKQWILLLAVCISLMILFIFTYISERYNTPLWAQIAPVVSIFIVSLTLYWTLFFKRRKNNQLSKRLFFGLFSKNI